MLAVGTLGVLSVFAGLARLGAWLIARRERDATAAIRDAAFAARAAAEVRK
ncbi:hypothetical protein [Stenotrophomonas sp. VV52]|uniref:hypothetical protein n=1 Tax=Stenotrophomonas sp. VV52 TaxID=2066958 RepID=UPI001558CCDF|nr:hypothetical protein [Stenotrophomonas sp. VV52]